MYIKKYLPTILFVYFCMGWIYLFTCTTIFMLQWERVFPFSIWREKNQWSFSELKENPWHNTIKRNREITWEGKSWPYRVIFFYEIRRVTIWGYLPWTPKTSEKSPQVLNVNKNMSNIKTAIIFKGVVLQDQDLIWKDFKLEYLHNRYHQPKSVSDKRRLTVSTSILSVAVFLAISYLSILRRRLHEMYVRKLENIVEISLLSIT